MQFSISLKERWFVMNRFVMTFAAALVLASGVMAGEGPAKTQAPVVKTEPKTVLVPTTVLKKETVMVPKTVVKKETVLVPVKVSECSSCSCCDAGVASRVRGRVRLLGGRVRGVVVDAADCVSCK